MAKQKRKKTFYCDRCKNKISKKLFYRYPHVWEKPSNTCLDSTYSVLLMFCHKCIIIFDKLNEDMRNKYLYHNNKKLIKFYEQYSPNSPNEKK